jgi:mannose-6-phosphate isomerase
MVDSYPLRLEPFVKEVVWGGRWLADELGRQGPPNAPLGESWEAYTGSPIINGEYSGQKLGELFKKHGSALFGEIAASYPRFPLLVKFIDAKQNLSVQVHPDDTLAQQLENFPFGKTEFWYVMAAEPGAELLFGLNAEARDREQLREAIKQGELVRYMQSVPVREGDVIFLPAGTVHALTKGIVVYELQQDCDITYRLYDWGRTGREIHIEKGLLSIDLNFRNLPVTHPEPQKQDGYSCAELVNCQYFIAQLWQIDGIASFKAVPGSFTLLSTLDGEGKLEAGNEQEKLEKGDTLLVPAGMDYRLVSNNPNNPLKVIGGWLNHQ